MNFYCTFIHNPMGLYNHSKLLLLLKIHTLTCVSLEYPIWPMKSSAKSPTSFFAPFPDHHMTTGCIMMLNLFYLFTDQQDGLTFPDKDLSIGAIVQNKAVVPNQQILPKRAFV